MTPSAPECPSCHASLAAPLWVLFQHLPVCQVQGEINRELAAMERKLQTWEAERAVARARRYGLWPAAWESL
jgi:hypothetical protein